MNIDGFTTVDTVPDIECNLRKPKANNMRIINALMESDDAVIAKEFDTYKQCRSATCSFHNTIRRERIKNVHALQRGNTLYLVKEVS